MARNNLKPFTDKYFLRSNEILKEEGLNPWVNMQVFVRRGPGKVAGIDEAVNLIKDNSNIQEVGGRIYAKSEEGAYAPKDTVMNIIVPVQEIMELETLYLGVPTAATTKLNDSWNLDLDKFGHQVREVVDLAGGRHVLYFGARHWHYNRDSELAKVALEYGASSVSTDNGAMQYNGEGTGTIPHALENIYAWIHGRDNAVVEATKAFDRVIDPRVPRIALVDYANREIIDSLATADSLGNRLWGVRVDTCGENIPQGGMDGTRKYWQGKGVTVSGVYALRQALDEQGHKEVKIALSSGFSNPDKVRAFNEAEEFYGTKLYDVIGAGFLDGPRTYTADIIAVGESANEVDFNSGYVNARNIIHKVGRPPRPNKSLERLL